MIEGDDCRNKRLRIAHHHTFAHEHIGANRVFEHCRCHVFTTGRDDEVFFAAGDSQVAIGIKLADITGAEPAIFGECIRICLGIAPILAKSIDAAGENLTIIVDAYRTTRQGRSHRADFETIGQVDRHRRSGFGEAIAFEHLHPERAIEVPEKKPQRSRPRHRVLDLAAERFAQLRKNELVKNSILQPQPERYPAGIECLRIGDPDTHSAVENASLTTGRRGLCRRVVDLFKNPRHRQ